MKDEMDLVWKVRFKVSISDENWDKYGMKLAIGWYLHREANQKAAAAKIDMERKARENQGIVNAEARAAAVAGGNALRQVRWESPLLKALLEPVGDVKEPWNVINNKKLERPHGTEWMTADSFIKLL